MMYLVISFVCANNRYVDFEKYISRTDKYGYKRDFKQYKCEDCSDCPIKTPMYKKQKVIEQYYIIQRMKS